MKLLTKYNRLNITATILTFVIGSCTFYFLLDYILLRELDERLVSEQQEVVAYVSEHNALPEIVPTKDQYNSYAEVTSANKATKLLTIKSTIPNEEGELREIQFPVHVANKLYLAKVDIPLEETRALLQVIIGVTVAMIGIILLIGFLINRIVIRRLWKPFYTTIEKVKNYHLTDQDALKLERVDIDEFSLLNQSINEMEERIRQDYTSLKDFTGQAAHEMQTPLAIIRNKLDTLLQSESLLQKNVANITDIEKAVQRLSKLHKSLLLLTKVENRQFALNETVRMDAIIEDKWMEYSEIAEPMNLEVKLTLEPTKVLFHHHLAEILINNLVGNAIRYNVPNGYIEIKLSNNTLTVTNTSSNTELDGNKLFKRFYRDHNSEEGNGLGLSIVKQICEIAGYTIEYACIAKKHRFTLTFHK